jgi:outer membrane protein OmpA-like peptidoglycan-associated protein
MAQKTPGAKEKAAVWYMASVAALAQPGAAPATEQQRDQLAKRLGIAQNIANDDVGSKANFIPMRDATGQLGGLYARALRVKSRPLPIKFKYGEATFTDNGEQAIQELIEAAKDVPMMTVVGHTDEHGSHDFNWKLSWDRAWAVKNRLVKAGIPEGRIKVDGRGKTQLLDMSGVPGANTFSPPEIDQLNRRVEWIVPPGEQ